MKTVEEFNKQQAKKELTQFNVGDTVRVMVKTLEGDKMRIHPFEGTVIARKGRGIAETFTVRKLSFGEGVERIFPLHSPNVDKIEVLQKGKVRRAKLYYLRKKTGKETKVATE